jgi:hypothetical protein
LLTLKFGDLVIEIRDVQFVGSQLDVQFAFQIDLPIERRGGNDWRSFERNKERVDPHGV